MKQTTRSLITLGALVLLAAGAGLFAYYGVHQKQEREQQDKEKKEKLFADFDKAKLKTLTVTAKGQTTVVAAKKPEGWEIVSPVQANADKGAVDALLDRLAGLKSKMVVEEKAQDLARYGLSQPALKVTAQLEGGKDLVLRAGKESSFDSSIYVAVGDSNDVLQAEGGFKWALEKDTFDLRDKQVMPFEDAQVKQLDVRVDANRFAVEKKAGKWELTAPTAEKADETTVNRLLGALRGLNASRFATDTANPAEDARHGLDKPRLEAAVTLESGARMTLVAGQLADEKQQLKTYARRKEALFIAEVPESIFNDLNVPAADLRDKTVLSVDKAQVQTVKIAVGGEVLTLQKEAGQDAGYEESWKLVSPAGAGEVKKWKLSSLLWAVTSLQASGFADENPTDLAKYGLASPGRTITLLGADGKELGSLAVGAEHEEKLYVKSGADKRVFEVEKSRLADVPAARGDILEEPKAAPDAGAATSKP